MKLKVTQKILLGYFAGFILLLAFAGLTLFNGKRIEATTVQLSQQKLPALIAVAALKSGLQALPRFPVNAADRSAASVARGRERPASQQTAGLSAPSLLAGRPRAIAG